jgi:hypothetical protein
MDSIQEALSLADAANATRRVVVIKMGRGRGGGTTILDWLIQRARLAVRRVLVGDGDRRNPTLSGFYPPGTPGGVFQPPSDETADLKDWITGMFSLMVQEGAALVLDLPGADRVLAEYGHDLAIVEFCEAVGFDPLALLVSGPEVDDFEHVLTIWRAGYFRPRRAILVLNEFLVRRGQTPAGAFDPILARPELRDMLAEGVRVVLMPPLPCMAQLRASGFSLADAMLGQSGPDGRPFDPVRQFMVRKWWNTLEEALTGRGAEEWVP